MTISSEGPLCLKIHLTRYELKKYFNSYNNINIEDSQTRKTIIMLFNVAVNMSDFGSNGKQIIEIFPTASGGCIFKFTIEPIPIQSLKSKETKSLKLKSYKTKNSPYIFCFKNFENLLSVIEELYKNEETKKYLSSLYFNKNKFFLKITLPIFDIRTGIFINEFSEYSTKGRIAESNLSEYAYELIKENATEILGKYFLKSKN